MPKSDAHYMTFDIADDCPAQQITSEYNKYSEVKISAKRHLSDNN